jgi:hypothetical protein
LKWTLTDGDVRPQVSLCHDRPCASPVPVSFDYIGLAAARPQTDLAPGIYFWSVTMTNLSGTVTSAVWEFFVGRHSAGSGVDTGGGLFSDYNGDTIQDLVIGERYETVGGQTQAGRVHMYLGQANALTSGNLVATPTLDGTTAKYAFGTAVSSGGDINGDGYADLIVGADVDPSPTPAGQVFIYFGNPSLDPTHAMTAGPMLSEAAGDEFGAAVTSVDLNGDGFNDIIVGAPRTTVNASQYAGEIHVYYGTGTGVKGTGAQHLDDGGTAYDNFGYALAAGDFNGDGYGDVAVSAILNPHITFFLGGPNGVVKDLTHFPPLPQATGTGFGYSVSAGDINGDGYTDLLVGAPQADSNSATQAGRTFVYLGGANGMVAQPAIEAVDGAYGQFGYSVSLGDYNGDGFADALIGAYSAPSMLGMPGPGLGYLFKGGKNGIVVPKTTSFTGENNKDMFGIVVGIHGDLDADGLTDLAFSAINFNSGAGKVYLCRGSSGAVPNAVAKTIAGVDMNAQLGISIY